MTPTQADIDRFMAKVEVLPSGCWFWTGARSRGRGNKKWYGSFWFNGKIIRAHKFANDYLAGRPCPPGHHRDHKCCFSLCVNPECIEVVTHEENQRRKVQRVSNTRAKAGVNADRPRRDVQRRGPKVVAGYTLLSRLGFHASV